FTRPRATAQTLLRVDYAEPTILGATPENRNTFANYQRSQLVYVKSRLVLNAALSDPHVADLDVVRAQPDPVEWLGKELKADYSLAPEVLRISLTTDKEEDAAAIVRAVRDAYLREVVDKERRQQQDRLDQLIRLHAGYEQALQRKRQRL